MFVFVVVVVVEANYTPTLIKQCCLKITPLQKKNISPFPYKLLYFSHGESTLSPDETTSYSGRNDSQSGRNDSRRTGHRAKRP